MKKGDQKKAYKLFGFLFLGFEIGANRFSINFSEMSFVIYSRKTGKYLNKNFLQEVDQESGEIVIVKF